MVAANFNQDEAMRRACTARCGRVPRAACHGRLAYRFGINYIIYAMTHRACVLSGLARALAYQRPKFGLKSVAIAAS